MFLNRNFGINPTFVFFTVHKLILFSQFGPNWFRLIARVPSKPPEPVGTGLTRKTVTSGSRTSGAGGGGSFRRLSRPLALFVGIFFHHRDVIIDGIVVDFVLLVHRRLMRLGESGGK